MLDVLMVIGRLINVLSTALGDPTTHSFHVFVNFVIFVKFVERVSRRTNKHTWEVLPRRTE